jgi:phosphohistidine phosphatase
LKSLLILRHAKSSLKDPNIADHERPLDELAKKDALQMGKLIRDKDLVPDFILSSTALRAKTTTELVVEGCEYKGDIALKQSLYKAKPKDYLKIIEGLSDRYVRVLLVGHNPAAEEAIEMFTGLVDIKMYACALAHLNLPIEKWSDLKQEKNNIRAESIEVMRPEELS